MILRLYSGVGLLIDVFSLQLVYHIQIHQELVLGEEASRIAEAHSLQVLYLKHIMSSAIGLTFKILGATGGTGNSLYCFDELSKAASA